MKEMLVSLNTDLLKSKEHESITQQSTNKNTLRIKYIKSQILAIFTNVSSKRKIVQIVIIVK